MNRSNMAALVAGFVAGYVLTVVVKAIEAVS